MAEALAMVSLVVVCRARIMLTVVLPFRDRD